MVIHPWPLGILNIGYQKSLMLSRWPSQLADGNPAARLNQGRFSRKRGDSAMHPGWRSKKEPLRKWKIHGLYSFLCPVICLFRPCIWRMSITNHPTCRPEIIHQLSVDVIFQPMFSAVCPGKWGTEGLSKVRRGIKLPCARYNKNCQTKGCFKHLSIS